MKVIFLHIPKTAGQSVHTALVNAYGQEAVCPARVNHQLYPMSIKELNRYQVFSGHLDWSLLDCIEGPKYVFTVLREPQDRILSFYFYLREEAAKLSADELKDPGRQGMRAALEMTPKEYFCNGHAIRNFLDDHYDNFYSYYFAARVYQGRSRFFGQIKQGAMSHEDIVTLAQENMAQLDDVFTIDNLGQVFEKIRTISGQKIMHDDDYRVNVNTAINAEKRLEKIKALGADPQTITRIADYCKLDNLMWARYATAPHAETNS